MEGKEAKEGKEGKEGKQNKKQTNRQTDINRQGKWKSTFVPRSSRRLRVGIAQASRRRRDPRRQNMKRQDKTQTPQKHQMQAT